MSAATKLLIQKLVVAFLVAFFGALLPALTGLGDSPNYHFDRAALIALVVGAFGAGIRAVLALGPLNIVPSDKRHSLIGPRT
jgi:hypothetical protein